jgi:hypothetical protein
VDDFLEIDDLVTGKAAEQLGEGCTPTKAVLVVETISEDGNGLRYVISHGVPTWAAIGMLRSALNRIEFDDLMTWDGDGDTLS